MPKSSSNLDYQDTVQIPIQFGISNGFSLLGQIHNEEIDAVIARLAGMDPRVRVLEGKIEVMEKVANAEHRLIPVLTLRLDYVKG